MAGGPGRVDPGNPEWHVSPRSTQQIHFLEKDFSTNVHREYRDPRNIHNFMAVFDTDNMFSPSLTGSGRNYTNSARPKDVYFFFASIPEPIITEGFDVFVQLVIAAITIFPSVNFIF